MAKGFNRVHKFRSSLPTNCSEQKLVFDGEIQKTILENHKSLTMKSNENNYRRTSQNFIQNLFYAAIKSKSKKQEKRKKSDVAYDYKSEEYEKTNVHMSQVMPTPSIVCQQTLDKQMDLKSISNGELKRKGILKKVSKTYSFSGSLNDSWSSYNAYQRGGSYYERSKTKHTKEISNDVLPSLNQHERVWSKQNARPPVKSVTFSDLICQPKCRPTKSISGMRKLSDDQEKDTVSVYLWNATVENSHGEKSIDSLQLQALSFCESSLITTDDRH